MNQPFTVIDTLPAARPEVLGGRADVRQPQASDDAVDSTAVRWVFAATVCFWVFIFEAGRMFF